MPEQPQSHIYQLEVQIPSTDGWKLGTDSKELIFTVSSTTKRDQMALLLGTTANCTTLDVVMTACKLPHLQLTNIQVLYSTVRWEIQTKIPGYNIPMMCEWALGALWFVASLPECRDRPSGLGASFSSMDSAVSPQDCLVLGTVAQCHQRQGKKGRAWRQNKASAALLCSSGSRQRFQPVT